MQEPRAMHKIFDSKTLLKSKLKDNYTTFKDYSTRANFHIDDDFTNHLKDLDKNLFFYDKNSHIFFETPDIQEAFVNNLNACAEQDIRCNIKQSSLNKNKSLKLKSILNHKYNPAQMKHKLILAFKRKIAQLKYQKQRSISINSTLSGFILSTSEQHIIRSRHNLIDNEIINFENRIIRLSQEDNLNEQIFKTFKPHNKDQDLKTQYHFFSNVARDDVEIYFKMLLLDLKITEELNNKINYIDLMHLESSKILYEQVKVLTILRDKNININNQYFEQVIKTIESKLWTKIPVNQDIKQLIYDIFDPVHFEIGSDSEIPSLQKRSDFMTFIPTMKFEVMGAFSKAYFKFFQVDEINDSNLGNKLHFSNQLCNFMNQIQRKFEIYETLNQADSKSITKTINEINLLEENKQITEKLKFTIPIINSKKVFKTQSIWKQALNYNRQVDPYEEYFQTLLSKQRIDPNIRMILNYITDEDSRLFFIKEFISKQKHHFPKKWFTIIENKSYINSSETKINLSLLNKLFVKQQEGPKEFSFLNKIKPEILKNIQEVLEEEIPQNGVMECVYSLQMVKIRDYYRNILQIVNAQQMIELQITYNLIKVFDVKIHRDLDLDVLLHQSEQRVKRQSSQYSQEMFTEAKMSSAATDFLQNRIQQQRRNAITSFSQIQEWMETKFSQEIYYKIVQQSSLNIIYQKENYEDIYSKKEELFIPEVYVEDSANVNKCIMFETSFIERNSIIKRIEMICSFYINKYEKIQHLDKYGLLIDRFEIVVQAFEFEVKFQFFKLRLIEKLFEIYMYLSDPIYLYNLSEQILNLIYKVPVCDIDGFNFYDSYEIQIQLLITQIESIKLLYESGKIKEQQMVKNHIEKIFRKLYKDQKPSKDKVQQENKTSAQGPTQRIEKEISELMENYIPVNTFSIEENNKKSDDQKNKQQQSSIQIQIQQYFITGQSVQLGQLLVGSPHFKYDNKLDFYDYLYPISVYLNKMNELNKNICSANGTSLLFYISTQLTTAQYYHQEIKNFRIKQNPFFNNSILTDELNLVHLFLSAAQNNINTLVNVSQDTQIHADINTYLNNLKDKSSIINLDSSIHLTAANLINFDYESIKSLLQEANIANVIFYKDVFLISNLFEVFRLFKRLNKSVYSRQFLHRAYKIQKKNVTNYKGKFNDLYKEQPVKIFSSSDHYFINNLQFNQFDKEKRFFFSYDYEIDSNSLLRLITLKDDQKFQICQLILPDLLESFRIQVLYETINVELLVGKIMQHDLVNKKYLNILTDCEILQKYRVLTENTHFKFNKMFVNVEGTKKIKKYCIGYLEQYINKQASICQKKSTLLNILERKQQEIIRKLETSKEPSDMNILLQDKKIINLKNYFARMMCQDLLILINQQFNENQLLIHLENITHLINLIPNKQSIFNIQKEIYENIEKQIIQSDSKSAYNFQGLQREANLLGANKEIKDPFCLIDSTEISKIRDVDDQISSSHLNYEIKESITISFHNYFNLEVNLQQIDEEIIDKNDVFYRSAIHLRKATEYFEDSMKSAKMVIETELQKYTRYYKHIQFYLESSIISCFIKIENEDIHVFQEMILFQRDFDKCDPMIEHYGQENQIDLKDPMLALMSYEQQHTSNNTDTQKPIISQSLDEQIEKVRSFLGVKQSFQDCIQQLISIKSDVKQNFYQLEETTNFFKIRATILQQALYLAIHQFMSYLNPQLETQLNSISQFSNILYSKFSTNNLNLNNLNTSFAIENNVKYKLGLFSGNQQAVRIQQPLYAADSGMITNRLKAVYFKMPFSFYEFMESLKLNFTPLSQKKQNNIIQEFQLEEDFNIQKVFRIQSSDQIYSSQQNIFTKKKYFIKRERKLKEDLIMMINEIKKINTTQLYTHYKEIMKQVTMFTYHRLGQNSSVFENKDIQKFFLSKLVQNINLTIANTYFQSPRNLGILEFQSTYNQFKASINDLVNEKRSNFQELIINQQINITKDELKVLEGGAPIKSNESKESAHRILVSSLLERECAKQTLFEQFFNISIAALQTENQILQETIHNPLDLSSKQSAEKKKISSKLAISNIEFFIKDKLYTSLSSPLIQQEREQISHGIKIPFLISFINKFRNKVHKVQTSSNNSIFQINSQEFEEALNYLNKELLTFCEKELRVRLDTASSLFEAQQKRILEQEEQIKSLKSKTDEMQNNIDLQVQTKVLVKCNEILFEMEKNNKMFNDFKKYTRGLEEAIRQKVEKQFKQDLEIMKSQNNQLINKFVSFKNEIHALIHSEMQDNTEQLIDFIRRRVNDAIQIQINSQDVPSLRMSERSEANSDDIQLNEENTDEIFQDIRKRKVNKIQHQQSKNSNQLQKAQEQSIHNRCADDEDVIYDPYVVTKFINKLRIFYILKISIQTSRFQKKLSEAQDGYSNLKNVHIKIQEYIAKEQNLKEELMKLQEDLNILQRQHDATLIKLETSVFEKKKYIKLCDDQTKKIQILEDSLQKLKNAKISSVQQSPVRSNQQVNQLSKSMRDDEIINQSQTQQMTFQKPESKQNLSDNQILPKIVKDVREGTFYNYGKLNMTQMSQKSKATKGARGARSNFDWNVGQNQI